MSNIIQFQDQKQKRIAEIKEMSLPYLIAFDDLVYNLGTAEKVLACSNAEIRVLIEKLSRYINNILYCKKTTGPIAPAKAEVQRNNLPYNDGYKVNKCTSLPDICRRNAGNE